MSKKITDKVTWVGKTDWELRSFHGKELSTWRGSSYNSYLVKDKKTALIDTVWLPYDNEFVHDLKKEIDLSSIDYVISNHAEVDHSGALTELMRHIPDTPIYCTAFGAKHLKAQYHKDWNFVTVKTGDKLDLGENELIFVEAPMLHWPDTMFCYLTGENILFSNDAFGQHYATETLFNDKVDDCELYEEAIKYYANILTPFSPRVSKKIEEVLSFDLPLNMICPSHGVIWKNNPTQIIDAYLKWADNYQENQITIIYDTMWNSTKKMAEAIAKGIMDSDNGFSVKIFNSSKADKNDIITEVFRSKALLAGSSTINNGYLYSMGGMLEMIKGLKFKNKSAAAFGSYGWSGESVAQIENNLKECGMDILSEGLKILWVPDEESERLCEEYGKKIAQALKK